MGTRGRIPEAGHGELDLAQGQAPFLTMRRWVILGGLAMLSLTAIGLWHWWRRPAPPAPLDPAIHVKQATVDARTKGRLDAAVKAKDGEIARLRATVERLKAEASARADRPLEEATRAGPDGLSKLATDWLTPGALARLKAEYRPRDPP